MISIKEFGIRKLVLSAPKLYDLQEKNSASVFCSFSYKVFYVGEIVSANMFKHAITLFLNENYSLSFLEMCQ